MSRSFLQSKDWARFQLAFGRKVFWIDDKLIVKFALPLGKSWLYAARVDLKIKNPKSKIKIYEEELFIKELSKIAIKENTIFAKIEENLNNESGIRNQGLKNIIHNSSFIIHNSKCLQPQDELLMDISLSEKEILERMHPKTRYNIRLAQKKGLKIVQSINPKNITHFYNLALETSQRNHFKYHSKIYYEKMMEVLGKSKNVKVELLIAYLPSQLLTNNYKLQVTSSMIPIAVIIMLYTKDTAFYLHGASSDKYHNLMATFLLQWEAICRAKKKGCKWYNLGGIAPLVSVEAPNPKSQIQNKSQISKLKSQNENLSLNENCKLKIKNYQPQADHPWSGITRFKLGFAPPNVGVNPPNVGVNPPNVGVNQTLHYPDAYDIVYQPAMYWIYKSLKKLNS